MAAKVSVTVEQVWTDTDEHGRNEYGYIVVQVKNATRPHIGEQLTERAVHSLIDVGVDVTIKPRG